MKSRYLVKRIAATFLAVGFLFVLVGDRATTATPQGIDPLEVLNLQIKPNVLIVLDTSGSMNDTINNNTIGGDHPDSKIRSAKIVMRQALTNNESKVNMMFGTYTNTGSNFTGTTVAGNNSANQDHFSYWARSLDFPSMLVTQLIANPIYAFQIIGDGTAPNARTNNNKLYFTEEIGATDAVCTATIPAHFYQSGAALAAAMQTAMNAATCTVAKTNTYTVTYDGGATTTSFTFTRATGARTFRMEWATTTNSIRGVLNRAVASTGNATTQPSGDARIVIMRRVVGTNFTEGAPANTYYELIAGRFFNGDTFYVQANGNVCDMTAGPPSTTQPFVNLQLTTGTTCPAMGATYGSAIGTVSGTAVRFDTAGGVAGNSSGGGWGGNGNSCGGFQIRSQLRACDNTTGQALGINTPFLEPEWQIATVAGAVAPPAGVIPLLPGGLTNREETLEGVGRFDATGGNVLPYGLTADGSTPIANSLNDMKQVFTRYYNGAAITTATIGTVTLPTSGTINLHVQPRERTIVLFITDGDDTCSGSGDAAARAAAARAQTLYTPLVGGVQNPSGQYTAGTDPASSVVTYLIGYGSGAQVTRLNMIAWGGSGMQYNFGSGVNPTAADRILCQTCQDAFVAPDPASLAAILQSIFDQGAQTGEFTAQQSIADSIYEYVDQAATQPFPADPFDARNPNNRFNAVTPVRFVSTFTLPGFNGTIRAYSNNGTGESVLLWSAGDKLTARIAAGMTNATACPIAANPGAVSGECSFGQLHGGTTDATIGTAGPTTAAIKRRIYTTSQNGYFGVTVTNLLALQAPFRVALWPPQTTSLPKVVAPTNLTEGLFDGPMGLPLDTAALPATEFTNLQTKFRVCNGVIPTSTPATNCASATALTRMQQARKEAREIILAFMAGAQPVIDNLANPKRVTSGANAGLILYKPKPWAMAESSLATAAVVGPPIDATPDATPYGPEYKLYHDGPRNGTGQSTVSDDSQVIKGFGLTSPDDDGTVLPSGNGTGPVAINSRPTLKPVMSVLYAGANDMLHAFRAGTEFKLGLTRTGGVCGNELLDASTTPPQRFMSTAKTATPDDCGGDELWGFVPFDQLSKLYSRFVNNPQKRDPHDYVVARGIRFSDIFIPGPQTNLPLGGGVTQSIQGVWRKVIYFGRGIAGNYMTALDVTAPGTYVKPYLQTTGPIPLWSRGNPDTTDGKVAGPIVNTAADAAAYATMGQTWSLPAIGYVDKTKNLTTRNPGGIDFALYVGSGYGTAGQGTTLYTMDARTGDIVASANVETVATANGMARPGRLGANGTAYTNAIVANPVAFNPSRFAPGTSPNPAAAMISRIYVGDLYGRLWKMLTASPTIVIPFADLEGTIASGAHQPIGTAASLVGLPPGVYPPPPVPYIFVTTGNDNRENGPFIVAAFRDDGDDTTTAVGATVTANSVKSFLPAVSIFTRVYDQGPVVNAAAPTPFPVFRGTAQPSTAFTDATPTPKAVAFFAGTRFNPPLSAFAPLPVPGNAATYPCRSTFDSILYALQADTGNAAYDLNAAGDDAYQIHQDSRVVGLGTEAGQGGSFFTADEGLNKPGKPADPPPPPGVPGQTTTANVRPLYRPTSPMPSAKFGSTVCQ
jgi:hypothetical protein